MHGMQHNSYANRAAPCTSGASTSLAQSAEGGDQSRVKLSSTAGAYLAHSFAWRSNMGKGTTRQGRPMKARPGAKPARHGQTAMGRLSLQWRSLQCALATPSLVSTSSCLVSSTPATPRCSTAGPDPLTPSHMHNLQGYDTGRLAARIDNTANLDFCHAAMSTHLQGTCAGTAATRAGAQY